MKVATYKNIGIDVAPDMTYLAYIVLPNGDYWGVRFNGATEEIARNKAIALWNKEQEKFKRLGITSVIDSNGIEHNTDPWAELPSVERMKHSKVWMRKGDDLKRVPLTEITMYEKQGYIRSGPRSGK